MFSPEASLYASTDLLLSEGGTSRKQSVFSEEAGDVYPRQVSMSVIHTNTNSNNSIAIYGNTHGRVRHLKCKPSENLTMDAKVA